MYAYTLNLELTRGGAGKTAPNGQGRFILFIK